MHKTGFKELVEQNLPQKAFETGNYLEEKLEGLKRHGVVREVRGKGMFRGVELMHPSGKSFPELGKALKRTALNNGLIMRIDPNWFSLAPALIAEKADIDEMMELIERSLLEALEKVS